ncbi:uncharacterized protein LOC129289153 [Prosopis cineraria]|uniref:uncharacterized protein LOC129289153 n=1 Tax=Prosopis cineraria TaxID=364024 RepID=UPI00240FBEC8|nr:uncharacterized protein LOC129289153 [Prosopis cineraria]
MRRVRECLRAVSVFFLRFPSLLVPVSLPHHRLSFHRHQSSAILSSVSADRLLWCGSHRIFNLVCCLVSFLISSTSSSIQPPLSFALQHAADENRISTCHCCDVHPEPQYCGVNPSKKTVHSSIKQVSRIKTFSNLQKTAENRCLLIIPLDVSLEFYIASEQHLEMLNLHY